MDLVAIQFGVLDMDTLRKGRVEVCKSATDVCAEATEVSRHLYDYQCTCHSCRMAKFRPAPPDYKSLPLFGNYER